MSVPPASEESYQKTLKLWTDLLSTPPPEPVITRHCTNGVEWEESPCWDFIRVYYIYCGERYHRDVTRRYGLDWALRQPTTAFDLTFYHLGKSKTPPEYFI